MSDKPGARKKLPIKRRKFVDALLGPAGGNATKAASIAGYANPRMEGHRLMTFEAVSEAVAARLDRFTEAMGQEEIIARLSGMARADMSDFFTTGRAVLPPPEGGEQGPSPEPNLPEERDVEFLDLPKAFKNGLGWLVESVSYDQEGRPKIKLHSSKGALETLAKIRGMLKDSPAQSVSHTQINVLQVLDTMSLDQLRLLSGAAAQAE